MKDLLGRLTARLSLRRDQVERTVQLFDDDNTVPFVARYRKEVTGGLDEVQLAEFRDQLNALRKLDDRQKAVVKSIEEQGKLTPDLAESIEEAETLQEVEDLYLPFKPRRRTRAQKAREAGLEPVAEWILEQTILDGWDSSLAEPYFSEEYPDEDEVFRGARDIVAEVVSEDARVRDLARRMTWDSGQLVALVTDEDKDEKGKYQTYYDFAARLKGLKPHQVLALNRGEADEVLRVGVAAWDEGIVDKMLNLYRPDPRSVFAENLTAAVEDAYKRLVGPAIEREVRRDLTEWADQHAINVFAENLRNLLLTPPLNGTTVIGLDPGYRTGCKVAVVDATGKVLDVATIYPHPPRNDEREALDTLHELVAAYDATLIAIGNGTASRETEELGARLLAEMPERDLHYLIVSEAGASVYSASPLARAELPDLDVSLRGAVSIARRAQDPLAELVKIDPKSIGVGMYQHDVNQTALADALARVTESAVNAVGVDANTASPALLQYVAGLGPTLAERIVAYRDAHGAFTHRAELKKVKGLGDKTFEQAAGFLRVPGGSNPLDNTGVHPESYAAVEKLLGLLDVSLDDPALDAKLGNIENTEALADRVGVGGPTLKDIIAELQRPGRDPRDDVPPPLLRSDVLRMEDLEPGMTLTGTVRNVVDFGAFVDIGVKQDGLVHISQMADRRIDSPYEVVGVGDVIEVRVLNVDLERGRIGLSMR